MSPRGVLLRGTGRIAVQLQHEGSQYRGSLVRAHPLADGSIAYAIKLDEPSAPLCARRVGHDPVTCARADDGSSAATRSLPPQKALAVGDWQGWVPDVSGINGRQLAQVIHSPVGARDDAGRGGTCRRDLLDRAPHRGQGSHDYPRDSFGARLAMGRDDADEPAVGRPVRCSQVRSGLGGAPTVWAMSRCSCLRPSVSAAGPGCRM